MSLKPRSQAHKRILAPCEVHFEKRGGSFACGKNRKPAAARKRWRFAVWMLQREHFYPHRRKAFSQQEKEDRNSASDSVVLTGFGSAHHVSVFEALLCPFPLAVDCV